LESNHFVPEDVFMDSHIDLNRLNREPGKESPQFLAIKKLREQSKLRKQGIDKKEV
jgi:hypothetical protein